MLSHMLLYYIYPCHIHRRGRGGDRDELTYSSLPLEGLQWVSILEFRSFKVNFEVERINFNWWTVKMKQREKNSWPLAIFCRFFIYKKILRYFALKQWGPLVGSPVGIRVNLAVQTFITSKPRQVTGGLKVWIKLDGAQGSGGALLIYCNII